MGIIPGSMGARSYIVRGKGNPESFMSCSHGAGRAMSRTEAKRRFTLDDHAKATAGVECRSAARSGRRSTHVAPGCVREGLNRRGLQSPLACFDNQIRVQGSGHPHVLGTCPRRFNSCHPDHFFVRILPVQRLKPSGFQLSLSQNGFPA
jgi:hypothetical protein